MSITYSYAINELEKATSVGELSDVVTKVKFTYSGEAEDGTTVNWPLLSVDMPAPNAEDFKPFSELTEADIISWLKVCYPIGPIQGMIAKQIDDQINPKEVVTEMPWATEEE